MTTKTKTKKAQPIRICPLCNNIVGDEVGSPRHKGEHAHFKCIVQSIKESHSINNAMREAKITK